jgi:hypothetical protein
LFFIGTANDISAAAGVHARERLDGVFFLDVPNVGRQIWKMYREEFAIPDSIRVRTTSWTGAKSARAAGWQLWTSPHQAAAVVPGAAENRCRPYARGRAAAVSTHRIPASTHATASRL